LCGVLCYDRELLSERVGMDDDRKLLRYSVLHNSHYVIDKGMSELRFIPFCFSYS